METIYIDIGDEITTVIERMKESNDTSLALVVPRGAVLLQSIVNLKLARKAAIDSGKEIVLVTTDKIGRNLASQVGIPTVTDIADAENGGAATEVDESEATVIAGLKVHRYYDNQPPAEAEPEATTAAAPIIPREILREKAADQIPEGPSPIVIREIKTAEIKPAPAQPIVPIVEPEPPVETVMETAIEPEVEAEEMPLALSTPSTPPVPPVPRTRSRKIVSFLVYICILLLLSSAGVAAFYLPKTAVTITVPSESWSTDATLTAQVGSPTLPAEIVTAEVSESVPIKATGTKELGNKASGSAKVFNVESSDPKTLPAGSQIVASGITFTTNEEVTVPGAKVQSGSVVEGSNTVSVTASQPGDSGNLTTTTATVPGQKLYAQITQTTGGTTKQVAVVTQTDIANGKVAVTKKLRESADAKLLQELQNRSVVFDEKTDQFAAEAFNSSVAATTEADSVDVSAKATLKRLLVDKKQIEAATETQLATTREASKTYKTDSVTIGTTTVTMDTKSAVVMVTAKGRSSQSITTTTIPQELAGKKRAAGEELLKAKVPNGTITVVRTPSWWPISSFPYSAKYLTVQVTYE